MTRSRGKFDGDFPSRFETTFGRDRSRIRGDLIHISSSLGEQRGRGRDMSLVGQCQCHFVSPGGALERGTHRMPISTDSKSSTFDCF